METVPLTHYVPVNQEWGISIDPAQQQPTTMVYVTPDTAREFVDVEISEQGRQLAQEDMINDTPRYFFSADINATLSSTLSSLPEHVATTAWRIIDDNFMNTGALSDDARQVALALGLSQADYLAEHYLDGEQRSAFLDAMQRIAVISTTRSSDENGTVSYASSPARIPGTNDYQVDWLAVMQTRAPEQFAAFQAEMEQGGNGLNILLTFVSGTLEHPGWAKAYQQAAAEQESRLADTHIDNRFAAVDRTSAESFMAQAGAILAQTTDAALAQTSLQQLARFLSALTTAAD